MKIEIFIIALLICIILYLLRKFSNLKKELIQIQDVLFDIKNGNYNRRILAKHNSITKTICQDINEITLQSRDKLISRRQEEKAYKALMTSLSHDVKTPLASLVGYLEAVQQGIAFDEEKEEYLRISLNKANYLKDFVEKLFDWVKLDSGEWKFSFVKHDLNELTRNIISDWIPVLEENNIAYEIEIPEKECILRMDDSAYIRSLNNIINNIIIHSGCNKVELKAEEIENGISITISDNGKGISKEDVPYIFERMYQADKSRLTKGSGLGLAIARELIRVNNGVISVKSDPNIKTSFTIELKNKNI